MANRRSDGPGSGQALALTFGAIDAPSRRRSGLLRAGCGVLFFSLLVAACRSAPSEPIPEPIAEVSIGVPESTTSDVRFGISEFVGALSLESLFRVGEDGRALPWLASGSSWEKDFTQLRIRLRPDVYLHDGRPLTAALVTEILKPAIASAANRSLFPAFNDVTSLGAEGDLDVVAALSRPSPMLPEDFGIALRTGEGGLVGTGPYRVVSAKASELVLERFERYHQGTPTIPRVVVRPVDTLRTAWISLLRGTVDVVSDVPADAVEFIRNDDVQVVRYQRRYQWLIAFNSRKGPLRSAAVRRALSVAVDRQRILDRVLQGNGTLSTGPLWPKYWAYDASVPPLQVDPQQARTILDEAGYPLQESKGANAPPSRFRFTCLIPNFSAWERIALEVQKDLLNIGVDMQIVPVSIDDFNTRIMAQDFDAVLNDMISGPTPARAYAFWRSRRAYQGVYNVFGYENAEAERLFDIVNTSTNDAAVRSAMRRLQEVLRGDPPALTIAWNTRARAIRGRLQIPQGVGDPLNSLWRWTPGPAVSLAAAR